MTPDIDMLKKKFQTLQGEVGNIGLGSKNYHLGLYDQLIEENKSFSEEIFAYLRYYYENYKISEYKITINIDKRIFAKLFILALLWQEMSYKADFISIQADKKEFMKICDNYHVLPNDVTQTVQLLLEVIGN